MKEETVDDFEQTDGNLPHSDVGSLESTFSDNFQAVTIDELFEVQEDNVHERDFIQKEHEGLIPERSVDSLRDNSGLIPDLRLKLADLSGFEGLSPVDWNKGEGHILSSDYIPEVDSLLGESVAVEMRELTGADYTLDSGAEAQVTHEYLATQTSDVFYNIAHTDIEDDSIAYEIDVMALMDFPVDIEGYDIDNVAVWRFTGITEVPEPESLGFVYSADPDNEKEKARESFDDEIFEMMDDAGWFGDEMLWDYNQGWGNFKDDLDGVVAGRKISAEKVHHEYPQRIENKISSKLDLLPENPSQAVLEKNGDRIASGREEITGYIQREVYGHDPSTENVLLRELSRDGGLLKDNQGGLIQIKKYDIDEVEFRVPTVSHYRPIDDDIVTRDEIPENSGGRPMYVHNMDRELQDTYTISFQE